MEKSCQVSVKLHKFSELLDVAAVQEEQRFGHEMMYSCCIYIMELTTSTTEKPQIGVLRMRGETNKMAAFRHEMIKLT